MAAHLSLWRCVSLLFLFTTLPHLLTFLDFSPCYIAMAQNPDIRRPLLRSLASLDSVHHLSRALHHPGRFLLFLVFLELAPILRCHPASHTALHWALLAFPGGLSSPDTIRASLGEEKLSRGHLVAWGTESRIFIFPQFHTCSLVWP